MDPEKPREILIVEDDPDMLLGLKKLMTKEGYLVETASDGILASELAKKKFYPLILLDLKLPGIDGFEVLKLVKETHPDSEVIILTGHGNLDTAIQALKLNASDFITKPFMKEAILVAVQRANEKIAIKKKLKEYTEMLEVKVQAAIAEIVRQQEFERKLIQSSIDGIVASDGKGKIIIYNEAAEVIFGFPANEVIQKINISQLYPAAITDEIKGDLCSQTTSEKSLDWKEITISNRRGEKIPVRFSGNILRGNGGTVGSVGFFHDLRQVKKLERELIRSERQAAIGQTMTSIAHYIKNILNGLQGGIYVVNAALEKNDMDRFKAGWEMLQRNTDRITTLVKDLLDYSRPREPEYRLDSVNEIIQEVVNLIEPKAREYEIKLSRDLDPQLVPVSLDHRDIHNAILNLVSNALDACISGSQKTEPEVIISTAQKNGSVLIKVSDNGVGMDEEVKKKLFTSFFSTKGGKGTGLGLLATQKIIQEHQGTIAAQSEQGKGSIFIIELPKAEKAIGKGGQ